MGTAWKAAVVEVCLPEAAVLAVCAAAVGVGRTTLATAALPLSADAATTDALGLVAAGEGALAGTTTFAAGLAGVAEGVLTKGVLAEGLIAPGVDGAMVAVVGVAGAGEEAPAAAAFARLAAFNTSRIDELRAGCVFSRKDGKPSALPVALGTSVTFFLLPPPRIPNSLPAALAGVAGEAAGGVGTG